MSIARKITGKFFLPFDQIAIMEGPGIIEIDDSVNNFTEVSLAVFFDLKWQDVTVRFASKGKKINDEFIEGNVYISRTDLYDGEVRAYRYNPVAKSRGYILERGYIHGLKGPKKK